MSTETLQDLRHQQASAAFESYNFGAGVTVEETGGWEYGSPGREMSRKVFYAVDDAPESDCHAATFTVAFASPESAVVVESYAMTPQGCLMGSAPPKSLEERVNDKTGALAAALLSMQIPGRGTKMMTNRPNVVTKIRRGVDPTGPWKHAVVAGRRLPEVAFADPSYEEFTETLVRRGCDVPLSTPVEDDRLRLLNGSGNTHGNTTLGEVLARAGLIGQSNPPAPPAIRKRASP